MKFKDFARKLIFQRLVCLIRKLICFAVTPAGGPKEVAKEATPPAPECAQGVKAQGLTPDKAFDFPLLGRGGQPWGYLSCSMCCCRSPVPPFLGAPTVVGYNKAIAPQPMFGLGLTTPLFLGANLATWPSFFGFFIDVSI